MLKVFGGNKTVYRLYGRAYARVKRTSPKVLTEIMAASTVIFTGAVLTINNLNADAIAAPIVLGELPYQKLQTQSLTDRAGIEVNVANGNVILKSQDLTVASAGPGLSITRFFNDLGTGSGQAGARNTLSVGADVNLTVNTNGSVTYQGPSGFRVTFPSNGAGGYTVPAEFTDASLVKTANGWTLTYHKSGEVYTFNAAGRLVRDANAAGLGITCAYNANGTLASATDAQGKVTTFSNYSGTNVGTITDPSGRTVLYKYNAAGQLSDVTQTDGGTWHFEYWDGRNLTWIVGPRNTSTTLSYDAANRVTAIRYADYSTAVAEYKYLYNDGNTVVTDPLGHPTTYNYDAGGRVIDIVDVFGYHRVATWDGNNNQTSSTDQAGQVKSLAYDALNNITSKQNPTTATGAAGAKDSAQYADPAHPYLPSKATDAAGNTVAYSYNVNGNVAAAAGTSAGGTGMGSVTNKYQGDSNGAGGTISCGAKAGQLCMSTDAKGFSTAYGYDSGGNVTTITKPGPVGQTTYTYDNLSRVQSVTDGNGSAKTFTYDAADRIKTVTYGCGCATIQLTYNADGYVTQRSDPNGTNNYGYDIFNRVVYLGRTGQADLNYTYDAVGNMTGEQGPAGTISYAYDSANELTNIYNATTGASIGLNYTGERLANITLPGGIIETITYDNAGRQTSIKAMKNGVTLTDYSGTYATPTGQDTELLQKETNNLTGVSSTYGYDGRNRLTSVTGTGTGANSWTYAYDANGNRTQYSKNGTYSALFGFNAANQLVTAGGYEDGTFDLAGNQTSTDTGLYMQYNALNQTASFTPGNSTTAITASYADAGQTDRTQLGSLTMQNGLLGLYSEAENGTTRYYTHIPTGSNQTVSQVVNGAAYYYLTDLRGSVVKMTDATGAVQNTYSYDPYGNNLGTTGTVPNAIRYTGGHYDYKTGLYKMGARYYYPTDGRWTQLDPSGQDKGYLYAGDNPVNYVDPSGNAPCASGLTPNFLGCPSINYGPQTPSGNPISFVGGPCQAAYVYGGIALDAGLLFTPLSAGASFAVGAAIDIALAGAAKAAC